LDEPGYDHHVAFPWMLLCLGLVIDVVVTGIRPATLAIATDGVAQSFVTVMKTPGISGPDGLGCVAECSSQKI
jgi:hypothetical protein